jgi:TusA-related sulfurtransferase
MDPDAPSAQLDLRGERCPMTFVRTRLQLESMALGEVLEVLVDFEAASRNIPKSSKNWGQACLAVEARGESVWAIRIQKLVE